jgi:zinc transporter ZupT
MTEALESKDQAALSEQPAPCPSRAPDRSSQGSTVDDIHIQSVNLIKRGEYIPVNFVYSVIINGVVDGFLIGLTVAEDPSAGYLIAAGLSVEMALLGIALTTKVISCSASTMSIRIASIMTPPLFLYIFCLIGAAVGIYFTVVFLIT